MLLPSCRLSEQNCLSAASVWHLNRQVCIFVLCSSWSTTCLASEFCFCDSHCQLIKVFAQQGFSVPTVNLGQKRLKRLTRSRGIHMQNIFSALCVTSLPNRVEKHWFRQRLHCCTFRSTGVGQDGQMNFLSFFSHLGLWFNVITTHSFFPPLI